MSRLSLHGPRLLSGAVLLGLLTLLGAADAAAQEGPPPVPQDTVAPKAPADSSGAAPDSAAVAADSTAAPADTLPPVEALVPFPHRARAGWATGVWEWDRADLMAEGAVTLTDLLQRIPGAVPIRAGYYGQPEAATAFGATGGHIQVVLDGYALDPLGSAGLDLSRIELLQLQHVRVERRPGGLRLELRTLEPTDPRPYSLVEAGMGAPLDAKLFRGIFQAPRVLGGPLSVGVERLDANGLRPDANGRLVVRDPANTFDGWVKWGTVAGGVGLQVELRNSSIERTLEDGTPIAGDRRDLVVRARGTPTPGVTTEAFFGLSSMEDGLTGETVEESGRQGGVRAAYHGDDAWVGGTLRARSHAAFPILEAGLEGGVRLPGTVQVGGGATWSDWRGRSAGVYHARIEAGPFLGLRPFAEASGGRRGAPFSRTVPYLTERRTLRAGAELALKGIELGGAAVSLETDSVAAFGLPIDGATGLFPGGAVQGWEATGRVPLFGPALALEGWYTRWTDEGRWIYLPRQSWRAALVYRDTPLKSDDFELYARLEGRGRGEMLAPAPGADGARGVETVPARTALDFYLQLRILDVRAFVRWDDMLHATQLPGLYDLPGEGVPGQRIMYGVKWQFWN